MEHLPTDLVKVDSTLVPAIDSEEWYQQLVDDCQTIITETEFTARWVLVEGYHALGMRILEEYDNFERREIYGQKIAQRVAGSLGKSERTLDYAVQFARKCPDLELLPYGKDVSWRKICHEYLPAITDGKEVPPLPEGKYQIIYADPPWNYSNKGPEYYGPAERHYDCLTHEELCNMNVEDIAAGEAVLFLWVTSPMLSECWDVIRAWGFEYKASFIWDKIRHNYGHYNSVRHELLLICTRGSFLPQTEKLFDSVVSLERSNEHSEKPEFFRDIIDTLYPNGPRIELFARNKIEGWDHFGDELPS